MNNKFRNLSRIEFVVTYDCTGHCIHCSEGNHPYTGNHIDETEARKIISSIKKHYKIDSVMTFGGEPLLYPDVVCSIHSLATGLRIPKRQLITNGYFTKDIDRIKEVSESLKNSGVNDVLLSVDAFHQQTIPLEIVKCFALELLKLSVPLRLSPAWLVSRDDDNPYNIRTDRILESFSSYGISQGDGNIIFPQGNAAVYLSEYFNPGEEYINPYEEDPDDIKSISMEPDNSVSGKSTDDFIAMICPEDI